MKQTTILFDSEEVVNADTKNTLKCICEDLSDRGYNPIKQITGYLISGDPGFISSYKECRNKITKLDRNSIIELMLKEYLDI